MDDQASTTQSPEVEQPPIEVGAEEVREEPIVERSELNAEIVDPVRDKLRVLPARIEALLAVLTPGAGSEVVGRAQELVQRCAQQLDSLFAQDDTPSYELKADNVAPDNKKETMSLEQIEHQAEDIANLCNELIQQTTGDGDVKNLDLDINSISYTRNSSEFWYLLTGNRQFKVGDEVQIGSFTIKAVQGQGREGVGAEDRGAVITKTDQELPSQQEGGRRYEQMSKLG